ncbi:hypothetical protein [Streptomyces sp. SP18CS02]|uniref:hypothetical protein n=1 Tax=Streptomyces sp. SP18CS02 TaxID=3002531 RepID=UPI002E77BDAE|nr:hypothetical protein [Streptomyces sp. SP18CS02]MEE1751884.1 hypothetical protein [Streptomyces sp. SP18CS02]
MKEIVAVIGWIVGVQGALGAAGRTWGDGPWGLLDKWWDIPTAGYVVIMLAGAALAVYGEAAKQRAAR